MAPGSDVKPSCESTLGRVAGVHADPPPPPPPPTSARREASQLPLRESGSYVGSTTAECATPSPSKTFPLGGKLTPPTSDPSAATPSQLLIHRVRELALRTERSFYDKAPPQWNHRPKHTGPVWVGVGGPLHRKLMASRRPQDNVRSHQDTRPYKSPPTREGARR